MDSELSSSFNNAVSARENSTAVDFSSSAATDAVAAQGVSARDQFSAVEMDFEARNWRVARTAIQNNPQHKDKKRMAEFLSRQESPQQAKASCLSARNQASKEYAPAVGGVLSKIEAFMKVGDIAMKTAPESVGLVWMGIRLCMHSVEDDFATFSLFSGAASDIIGILLSCRVYGKMYGGDGGQKGKQDFKEMHQKVVELIPTIYTKILEFSYQMSKQMGRNMGMRFIKGLLSSAVNKFKPIIDDIRSSEKTMSSYAQKATEQLSIYYLEVGLTKQGTVLENQETMKADLATMKDVLKELGDDKKNWKKKTPLDKAEEEFDKNKSRLKPSQNSEFALERGKSLRTEGTCEWIFAVEEYKTWRTSVDNCILWVSGLGGMGKSVLMATVIDRLQTDLKDSPDSSAQYFICSTRDDSTRLATQIKNQLLYQLYELSHASGSLTILEKANALVEKYSLSEDTPSTDKKKSAAAGFEETYIPLANVAEKKIFLVIDALDECADRQESNIIKTLQSMLAFPNVPELHLKIIICSRRETDIVDELSDIPELKIEDHNGPDIERDAKSKINELPGFSMAERALACEVIVKKAKGLFRCVDPAIDFLKKPLKRPLDQALAKLPDGLNNSYQQIFRQTDPQYLDLLKTALHWCILGKRKPTIAEVMDDYSCAYEQDDGSDINPYDDMNDPAIPTDMKRLIHDQIRTAGSNTFLEIEAGAQVKTRHTTVTDFFLPSNVPPNASHDHSEDNLCPECRTKASASQTWTLSRKEGHLKMAITIFKHLNSALFRKRYLPESSEVAEAAPETTDVQEVPNGAVIGSKNEPSQENGIADNFQKGEPLGVQDPNSLDDKAGNGVTKEEKSVNITIKVSNNKVAENVAKGNSDPEHMSPEVDGIQDNAGMNPASAGPDDVTENADDEDDDGFDSDAESANPDEGEQWEGNEVGSSGRYELLFWPYHMQQAEIHWTDDEKKTNDSWKELWTLVLKFLCDSPRAFHTWQQSFMALPDSVWGVEDGVLSPLQVAAAYGLTGLCQILVQRGESAAAVTTDGRSALWFGTDHSIELLKLLLEHGADPNKFESTLSPFHKLLFQNPSIDKVKLMIEFNADCKLASWLQYSAVHWCGYGCRDVQILRLLIAHGGEINATDELGETGLHKLMWQDNLPSELLYEFLKNGADVNKTDKDGQQPLYEVCSDGSEVGCRILLDHGAEVDHADKNGITALHAAAEFGHLNCIKVLIEKNASLLLLDVQSRTAFFLACLVGNVECVKYILSALHEQGHSDIICQQAKNGKTPFSKACERGNTEVVRVLLTQSDVEFDINATSGSLKRTALHQAAKNGKAEVVSLLLENGADAKIHDTTGKTALSLSGSSWSNNKSLRREPLILALIDHDAATAAQDSNLMANAAMNGSAKVIEKLVDLNADPSKQDEHGWTPLQLARQYGHAEAATVLAKRGAVVGARPSRWSTDLTQIEVSENGRSVQYKGQEGKDKYTILTNHPVPAGIERFYFEITLLASVGSDGPLEEVIGFATQPGRRIDNYLPGWWHPTGQSWGFHGDDGNTYTAGKAIESWEVTFYGKGATVGCGVVYRDGGVDGSIFFTKDGASLGVAFDKGVLGRLYPAAGMAERAALEANWGNDLETRPFLWAPGNGTTWDLETVKKDIKEEREGEVEQEAAAV